MALLTLFVGVAAFAVVAFAGLLLRSWHARRRCPECGGATVHMRGAVPLPSAVELRWCAACGWKGVGRSGPRFDPEHGPVNHESGFRWRSHASPSAPRFEWGGPPETPPPGFHFAEGSDGEGGPPGFTFAEPDADAPSKPEEAFDWGERTAVGFKWGGERS